MYANVATGRTGSGSRDNIARNWSLGDLSRVMLLRLHASPAQEAHGPARYTGAGVSGRHHVRGKDCVHPDIGLVIVRMISFPAREIGQRARMAVP